MRYWLLVTTLFLISFSAQATVQLAPIFGEGMVLQQGMKVPIWGTADDGETVTVSFCGQTVTAKAVDKHWRVDLSPLQPGGPWPLTVTGTNAITLQSVYAGEVWFCSGQSNMVWPVKNCSTATEALTEKTDMLRLTRGTGTWQVAEGTAIQAFSGTAYYFGKQIAAKRQVPVGLILAAVGGTRAELWTPLDTLKALGYASGGRHYAALIAPKQPYAIRGVIWYQGESNAQDAIKYAPLMTALITSWRAAWGQGDFPFLFVQLPRIGGKPLAPVIFPQHAWALLREQQARTLAVPNTGMAVYFDATDGNLHPNNKQPIGERLALLAEGIVYGGKPADTTSPVFTSVQRVGEKAVLSFSPHDAGLIAKDAADGRVTDFFLVAANGRSKQAKASVEGHTVVVDLTEEKGLPDLYYAWSAYPQGNLFSTAGLPVSPFRLQSLRLRIERCEGHEISLSYNQQPDQQRALKTDSYRIEGNTVLKAEAIADGARILLTLEKPCYPGQTVTVTFPGFLCWDGQTPIESASFTVPVDPAVE